VRHLSRAIFGLLDHLGLERAILCGHSLGGLVCADAALAQPERVERLVLISSAGLFRFPLPLGWLVRTMIWPGLVQHALERNAKRLLDRVFAEENERTARFRVQSLTRPDPRFVRDLGRVIWALRRDLVRYHLHDEVARLTMPTLVLWGAEDRLLPFGPVPGWARALPDGALEVIERCGHMAIIERPDLVVGHMSRFLSRAPRASAAPSDSHCSPRSTHGSSSRSTAS
jgi:pimeloyl-ACP methyl ester carboxylesterase